MCFAFYKEDKKEATDVADVIFDVAEDMSMQEYKKPLKDLEEFEKKEIIMIAENEVLGI